MEPARRIRTELARHLWVAALFYLAARAGLLFSFREGTFCPVWPAAGIAMGLLGVMGLRYWPGVALAEAVVAFQLGKPMPSVALIAAGATLEAALGAWIFRSRRLRGPELFQLESLLGFVGGCALAATLVGAAFGTLSVAGLGGVPGSLLPWVFEGWWIGDALGVLVFLPLFARLAPAKRLLAWRPLAELALLLGCVAGVTHLMFHASIVFGFALFPLLVAGAVRLGSLGPLLSLVVAVLGAVWSTGRGHGPFALEDWQQGALMLQAFIGALGLGTLILCTTARTEREADELRAARRSLREAVAFRDQFLAVASHELKTPLTGLRLQLELLARALRTGAASPEAAALGGLEGGLVQRADEAREMLGRLVHLVDDLFDVSRIDAGQLPFEREHLDLSSLLRDLARRYRPVLAEAGCALELDIAPGIVGSWDGARLEQVVVNLLVNAAKYAPGAPVRLSLSLAEERARIRVRDHGPGIPPGRQERIFDRFERGAAQPGRPKPGLGLGLFIAREIVQAHQGLIAVRSREGEGAEFSIELPGAARRAASGA